MTRTFLAATFLFLVMGASSISAQCVDYRDYIHWVNRVPMGPGFVGAITSSGNLLYLGAGNKGLQILDTSEPITPVVVGSLITPGPAMRPVVVGNYAYVPNGLAGLAVVDISNRTNPAVVGQVDTEYGYDVAVVGSHAYLADYFAGFRVIDISNPQTPFVAGTAATGVTRSVAATNSHAYVADLDGMFRVIDISNPANPTVVGGPLSLGMATCERIIVVGNLAYVTCGPFGLKVVSIADPANPVLLGGVVTPHTARGFTLIGNRAYVASASLGVQIIDVSNPVTPVTVDSQATAGSASDLTIVGSYAYVTQTYGIDVIQLAPSSVPPAGLLDTPSNDASGIAIAGNYAYLADGASGLRVVDISNPVLPELVTTVATPGAARRVSLGSDVAYVVSNSDVQVINISNPATPVNLGTIVTPGFAQDVAFAGNLVIVADQFHGVQVIDASTSTIVGNVNPDFIVQGVDAAGNRAYATAHGPLTQTQYGGQLEIIDVASPASPAVLGSWHTTAGGPTDVTVVGTLAFVAVGLNPPGNRSGGSLHVVDISNPANPAETGMVHTPDHPQHVAVAGSHAYLCDEGGGVQVIDISNPAHPFLVGAWNPGDLVNVVRGATVSGEYVFVAERSRGLVVLPAQCEITVPVLFSSIHATVEQNSVMLKWDLAADQPVSGFEVYRATPGSVERSLANHPLDSSAREFRDDDIKTGGLHEYYVVALLPDGGRIQSLRVMVEVRSAVTLFQNRPNPFNPTTTIDFNLPGRMHVRVRVFDVNGRLVRTLVDGVRDGGPNNVTWNGRNNRGMAVASGVYFCRLTAGKDTLSQRMVLLK